MTYFLTSDHHFNHHNIIELANRPFDNLQHMHSELINRWNEVFKDNDTVFIIGDFAFRKGVSVEELFGKLKGHKVLIDGNHDDYCILKSCYVELFGKGFELVHRPIDSSSHYTIHGHVHNNGQQLTKQKNGRVFINVNVEHWNYYPVSQSQLYKLLVDNKIIRANGK